MFYMPGTKMLFGDAKDTCEGEDRSVMLLGYCPSLTRRLDQLSSMVLRAGTKCCHELFCEYGRLYPACRYIVYYVVYLAHLEMGNCVVEYIGMLNFTL